MLQKYLSMMVCFFLCIPFVSAHASLQTYGEAFVEKDSSKALYSFFGKYDHFVKYDELLAYGKIGRDGYYYGGVGLSWNKWAIATPFIEQRRFENSPFYSASDSRVGLLSSYFSEYIDHYAELIYSSRLQKTVFFDWKLKGYYRFHLDSAAKWALDPFLEQRVQRNNQFLRLEYKPGVRAVFHTREFLGQLIFYVKGVKDFQVQLTIGTFFL